MKLGEMKANAKKISFEKTKLTRSDVFFAEENQYATLSLKQSKTDTEHTRVQIIFTATNDATCPISALGNLFALDLRPPNVPLFRLLSNMFLCHNVITILRKKLNAIGLLKVEYSRHSFWKEAA